MLCAILSPVGLVAVDRGAYDNFRSVAPHYKGDYFSDHCAETILFFAVGDRVE
jgi:hypothetical protein